MKRKRKKRAKSSTAATPKKRRRSKKRSAAAPAAKKRRRSVKRRSGVARRSSARRRRRAHSKVAAPRRRRARRAKAAASSHRRSSARRATHRRRRRNPAIPAWAAAAGAMLAGLASYAVLGAGTYAATQRLDPSMATLQRNQYIAGGVGVLAGIAAAVMGFPALGVGIGSGGAVVLAGTDAYLGLGKFLDKEVPATPAKPTAPAAQVRGLFNPTGQQITIRGLGGVGALYPMAGGRATSPTLGGG